MRTEPKLLGIDPVKDAPLLEGGRYGTREMCDIWGTDTNTYLAVMEAQSIGLGVLDELYPDLVPRKYIDALVKTANFEHVNPDRIRELEAKGEHDVIAINTAWGEAADQIEHGASAYVGFVRTSADSTETGKAIRCMHSLQVYSRSLENLRDILLEKTVEWINIPFMDQTHFYDALPTVAGRPFSFYAETLQSDLDFIKFIHNFSLMAKWADATGNHHAAVSAGINGIALQEAYAKRLGLRCMNAPAQVPSREFNADVVYALARTAMTLSALGEFIARGRGDDMNVFQKKKKKRKKGSSSMPHKDAKNGNPTAEEQAESFGHYMLGVLTTTVSSIKFRYGRDLSGSASDRLTLGASFKFGDHVTRRLADVVYWLSLNEGRSLERLARSYGVTTSSQVLTYLLASEGQPISREYAHDLIGQLATKAYNERRQFLDVLLGNDEISTRLSQDQIQRISDSQQYIGQSKEIIRMNYGRMLRQRTFPATL